MELSSTNQKRNTDYINNSNDEDDNVFLEPTSNVLMKVAPKPNQRSVSGHRALSRPSYDSSSPISIHNRQFETFREHETKKEIGKRKGNSAKQYETFSKAYSNYPEKLKPSCTSPNKTVPQSSTNFTAEFDDEISTGLPSDLPSDLFDIEGNLLYGNIQQLRFDLEEEDFSSADEDYPHRQQKFKNQKKCSQRNATSGLKDVPEKISSPCSFATSPSQRKLITSPNKVRKQQFERNASSTGAKFSPIFTTCNSISPKKETVTLCGESGESGKGTGGINAKITFEREFDSSFQNLKSTSLKSQSSVKKSKEKSSNQFNNLLINNSVKKGGSAQYQLIGKRSLSSNTSSSSTGNSGAHKNNISHSGSSGGNFSPPSEHFRSPISPFDRHHSSGGSSSNHSTLLQHYYPETGYAWVILFTSALSHVLANGFQLSFSILWNAILARFGSELQLVSCWLGSVSLGISLLLSPVWVSICKKKSTRLSAVFGGLVASLGCLFTSFATQFHQLFISYGAFLAVGVGLTRDASTLMIGAYFKRKKDKVEICIVAAQGLGIMLMSILVHSAIGSYGWRIGLQSVTLLLALTFFLGMFFRSASLYHPQRRAILHLKNQKRKVKEKGKREDKPPFIDCGCLKSKTLRIILMSSSCTAFGIFTPLLSLAVQCSKEGFEDCSVVLLHIYLGLAWMVGCGTIGLVVIQRSEDCKISKQYLLQVTSLICGISILALTAVKGANGMIVFSWVYGASLGGYCYSLKVYTYERARARNFPRAWSFLQSGQAIPLIFGVPLTNYANEMFDWKAGYYMSALAVFFGTACLFLTDVRRRKLSRRKSQNSSVKTCETTDGGTSSPRTKRLSFAFPVDHQQLQQQSRHDSDDEDDPGGPIDPSMMMQELTDISEEGLADLDFQDIYFDELAEYIGGITSCNKVENCLMSEYEHHHPIDMACVGSNANSSSSGSAQTTGRLFLPGIGTVFEVPLLVAKRLHPNLGKRSNVRPHHHQHHDKAKPCTSLQEGDDEMDDEEDYHDAAMTYTSSSTGKPKRECMYSHGENCVDGKSDLNNAAATHSTRVYHHRGKARESNNVASHFPAIDEDSV